MDQLQTNTAATDTPLNADSTNTAASVFASTAAVGASGNSTPGDAATDSPINSAAAIDATIVNGMSSADTASVMAAATAPSQPLDEPAPTAGGARLDSTSTEQLQLLRKIDGDIGALTATIEGIEQRAVRNGAIAGGVAGGVAGGIVATGIAFIRHKLGF
ncbi:MULTISPECIES: hypothetical protein [Burkholderia]|uniref:hypothetical protein n=1 Tax=Burkholderia TaxID=32008 RepID=UPI000554E2A1|nr:MULTISPECIES: hypothetical protein [Burkholderia]TCT31938.1 hypothetical protein EC918_102165 [Burkholderia vietnamiensis]SCZ28206.1 hypothetical protein SAMN02787148_106271 [Burkholderia vietnamiensis]SFX63491.1 hypothetical protein SAMN02787160_106272 [Burkholderia vietnamiensis]HDR9256398.1 hypothetical protein [Burkholderia vietnamiensis]